jgi:DNA topoisomerase-2
MDNSLAKTYQKKTDKQHILDNPDTYIGSIENIDTDYWVYKNDKIVSENIMLIPGLFKLFDEGIVNCRDHVIRMKQKIKDNVPSSIPVSNIDISIEDDGSICMVNDGNGIDIVKHPEYDVWIPELIFGHLRTSTNYDKTEKKIVGGKNGFGFKLVLIWSEWGYVETVDHVRKLKYRQEFKNNLDEICKPKITKCSTKPYTKIVFKPDYKRFGISGMTDDIKNVLIRRVYDVAGITDKNIRVKLNSNTIPIKNFSQYIDLYIGSKEENKRCHESHENERWEYAVSLSPTHEFQQISFVNGIFTSKGGKHVDYILNQITKKMVTYIEKKKKVTVTNNSIKEQLTLFLRCDIENPAFDSQTKDYMNTPSAKFGSSCTVSDKFIEKMAKMGVLDAACAITNVKENKNAKKTDGSKTKNVRGIHKLIDANWAGTSRSGECSIILCEGDSAKAGIVSGLSTDDRNKIGVYPMKGKVLNVRGELQKKITENKEINEIKKILGLEINKKYTLEDVKKTLRYGKILFMTDQDLDGSHIKGLGLNLFQSQWHTLSKLPEFIGYMNTPILKATKGTRKEMFYNDGEYEKWKETNDVNGWKIKYYKGLGTSTGKEFKEYFQNKKLVYFTHSGESCDDAIDKVFNKKRADDRKDWLAQYDRSLYLDTNADKVSYEDFVNKEMIHFSKYDCDRSIPNLMDGLKISLRKILFSAFKKNLANEIKVAQFSGYVSENSGYHHGEASLNMAIVGMAQNYTGSNNINLLEPNGQFGTRMQGGKDSASERYIFTQLNKITRYLYSGKDDAILKYNNDDGDMVEPVYYLPIIPMVLVNGVKGIGTGFSTEILPYDPLLLIDYISEKLTNKDTSAYKFTPYWNGFNGDVYEDVENKRYLVKGKYSKISKDTIHVTELPIGFWTDDFKQLLESLMESVDKNGKKIKPVIKEYDDMSKSTNIDVRIKFMPDVLDRLMKDHDDNINILEKTLKLTTSYSTNNMHLFDGDEKLTKYSSVIDIIEDYYIVRLKGYTQRKNHIINVIQTELVLLSNRKRYIEELLNGSLDFRNKKKNIIVKALVDKKYDTIDNDNEFKYLLKMPMDSVSTENVDKIVKEHDAKLTDLDYYKKVSETELWLSELQLLKQEYVKYSIHRDKVNKE